MPTVIIPGRVASIVVTGGSSNVSRDDRGAVVVYHGELTVNGVRVWSPRELRDLWAQRGGLAMRRADRSEHGDQVEHFNARGEVGAYAVACQILDHVLSRRIGIGDAPAALQLAADMARKQAAQTDLNGPQLCGVNRSFDVLDRLTDALEDLARYEWRTY